MRVGHYHNTRKLLRSLHAACKLQQLNEPRDSYKVNANASSLAAAAFSYI